MRGDELLHILHKYTCININDIAGSLKELKLSSDSLINFASCTGRLPDTDEATFIRVFGVNVFIDLWNRGFMIKARGKSPRELDVEKQNRITYGRF